MSRLRLAFALVVASSLCLLGSRAGLAAPDVVSGSLTLAIGHMQQIPLTFSGTVSGGVASITSFGPPAAHNGFVANGGFFTPTTFPSIVSQPRESAIESTVMITAPWNVFNLPGLAVRRQHCWGKVVNQPTCALHPTVETTTTPGIAPPTVTVPVTFMVMTPGTTMGAPGTFQVSVGPLVTTGTVTAMGTTRGTNLTGMAFDNRTVNGVGTLQLVSPVTVTAPRFGTTTVGFNTLTLVYANAAHVPMLGSAWGLPLLLGTVASLGFLGLRRMRS
jgi:hypothetical protein